MKFSIALNDFQKVLQKTLPAIASKSTIPVLEHLQLSLEGNKLTIIATDQDITITSTLEVEGVEDGGLLVPGRKLNDIVKAFGTEGNLDFSSRDDNYEIKLNTSYGKYTLKGLSTEEYLTLPELFESKKPEFGGPDSTSVGKGDMAVFFTANDIVYLAEKTAFAVSTDEFRPAMTGVLFQFKEDSAVAVATDSFRLVRASARPKLVNIPADMNILIPARSVELLKKCDADVAMSFIESRKKITHIRFDFGNTIFITRIIDEKFPPYETVIPTNNQILINVDHRSVLNAIRRIENVASYISKQIRLGFDNGMLTLKGEDEELGTQGVEEVPCDYTGTKFEIGFNYKFLEEAFNYMDVDKSNPQVEMAFSEPNKPALFKPTIEGNDLLMLIMPVRLGT